MRSRMTRSGAALAFLALLGAEAAPAEAPATARAGATVVAARALPARTVIAASDVTLTEGATPGALERVEEAEGLETRVAIYARRPIRPGDLAPPALVERNQLVEMRYRSGRLSIAADGRALDRAGLGERVRVMNLDSRVSVTGVVSGPGQVEVH